MEYDYKIDFEKFQGDFRLTQVSGEEVGETIAKMANYFAKYNLKMGDALRNFSRIRANLQNQIDDATGKPMTSSKAETLSDATPEADIYEMARIHVQNIDNYINALKSLQKGVLQEYAHS